jgi:hypothetical protein
MRTFAVIIASLCLAGCSGSDPDYSGEPQAPSGVNMARLRRNHPPTAYDPVARSQANYQHGLDIERANHVSDMIRRSGK